MSKIDFTDSAVESHSRWSAFLAGAVSVFNIMPSSSFETFLTPLASLTPQERIGNAAQRVATHMRKTIGKFPRGC